MANKQKSTKTTFAAISDLHQHYPSFQLNRVDCLVIAGDIFQGVLTIDQENKAEALQENIRLQSSQINKFVNYLSNLPVKQILIVAGNNDYLFEQLGSQLTNDLLNHSLKQLAKEKGLKKVPEITYLENQTTVSNGLRIYGTPYSSLQPEGIYPRRRAFVLSEQDYQEKL